MLITGIFAFPIGSFYLSEGTSQLTSYSYLDDYQPNQVLAIFDRWAKQNFQQNPILRCLSTCASYVDRSLSSRITLTLVQVPGAKLVGSDMYGISQGCDHLMVGLSQFYPPCESGDGTGARTRIVSLKGWCPDRLDDTAMCSAESPRHWWDQGLSTSPE